MASGMLQGQGPGPDLKMCCAKKSFPQFDIATDFSDHKYGIAQNQSTKIGEKSSKAIMKEWKFLQNGLPESIFVRVYEQRIDLLRAVIIGPPKTPYHNGLFFFDFQMPSGYPHKPPKVHYHSYGLRLNPNLYTTGYVCLSLLNTWNGPPSTQWSPNKSTILQVLLSLQALVLNDTPFYNEPGFGNKKWFKNSSMSYNTTTFLYSCMTMRYLLSRPPKNFEGFVVEHFRLNSRFILSACLAYVNGFVEVGKYEDEESYLNQRIKLKENHMVKMREHLPLLFQFFQRIDPSLSEFRTEMNEKIRRKCIEYAEKGNAAAGSMNAKKRQPAAGILRLLSKLFICGSSNFNNNPPFLL